MKKESVATNSKNFGAQYIWSIWKQFDALFHDPDQPGNYEKEIPLLLQLDQLTVSAAGDKTVIPLIRKIHWAEIQPNEFRY